MTTKQFEEPIEPDFSAHGDTNQYLTFIIEGKEYGVDILRVQEIKSLNKVTKIPNTPDYIQGVLNLRGKILPVIDMRKCFQLESIDYDKFTVIVVLKVVIEKGERMMGFIVDAISDVHNVTQAQLQPPPDFGTVAVSPKFIRGMATVNDNMIILLDIDRLVGVDIIAAVSQLESETTH